MSQQDVSLNVSALTNIHKLISASAGHTESGFSKINTTSIDFCSNVDSLTNMAVIHTFMAPHTSIFFFFFVNLPGCHSDSTPPVDSFNWTLNVALDTALKT